FFLSDRAERGTAALYRLALDGGEAEPLPIGGAADADYQPLPDGRRIAVLAPDPPDDEQRRRERERDDTQVYGERWPLARLHLLDLATKAVTTLDVLRDRHAIEVAPSPDGDRLAVISGRTPELDVGPEPGERQLHLVDLTTGAVRNLCDLPGGGRGLTWAPDGRRLVYIDSPRAGGVSGAGLFVVDVAGGPPRNLAADLPACPVGLTRGAAAATLLVTVATGLDTALYTLDPTSDRLSELITRPGDLSAVSVSADGATIAALWSTATAPVAVWAGPPAGDLKVVADPRPELRSVAWGAQARLRWTVSDGLALDGLLILPPGATRADGPFPLVTLVHGGPYGRFADGFQLGWAPSGQWLATHGYAVFLPNPRGGLGHGQAFAACVAGAVGIDDYRDIIAGLDQLIAEGVADADRLGIGGWSQGGFMTAWAVGQSDRFKAGVMGAGVSDWGMMVAESDMAHFEAALGGSTGWEGPGPHRHDALSPISFAHRVTTPLLILHGERDERVPVSQGRFFARALRAHGVPHELVVYPREPHGLRERAHQLDALRRTRAWFDRWLRPSDTVGVPNP
ncbi:MAG: S9 family peptidase, partial [Chloroflexi bacterium]|nr:S9 family peptidase [Chloroflexota bacterium]